jgi:phosphonate metabolism protein PhnN/1,5-bisphosphokinase (PRPP-forming)
MLVLVVGPSGAGKDSLIGRAREALEHDRRFVFARRVVTRPASDEDHDTLDDQDFRRAEETGGFLLSWRAHGLAYGIPACARDDLARGRVVVANVSRAAVQIAEELGVRVRVLHVTASWAILAARIAARGRETTADIERRLGREAALHTHGAEVVEMRNDGPLDHGAVQFIDALKDCVARLEASAQQA